MKRVAAVNKLACFILCLALVPAVSARADTYSFFKITNNGNDNVASQLLVNVTQNINNSTLVDFMFTNDVGTASSITDIYFDDGTLLAISSITSSSGVAFGNPASPGNLPGGNLASPPFVATQGFSADSVSPITANGVDLASEWVTITFSLQNEQTFADTIAALNDRSLRIGLHVQAIGAQGGSDSYVNGGVVPAPSSFIGLAGLGLTGLVMRFRRRRSI